MRFLRLLRDGTLRAHAGGASAGEAAAISAVFVNADRMICVIPCGEDRSVFAACFLRTLDFQAYSRCAELRS